MTINNEVDAKAYLKEVHRHMTELRKMSIEAGMNSHAAIWLTIQAAFMEGMDEVQTISDMVGMYLEAKYNAMESEYMNK